MKFDKTYEVLAEIAEKQGDEVGAARYRRQAQEAKSGGGRAAHELKQHKELIDSVIAATQGHNKAKSVVEQHQTAMRQGGVD